MSEVTGVVEKKILVLMRTQQQIYINDLDISIIPLIRSSIMISFTLARNELQGTRADLSYWTRISEKGIFSSNGAW